MASVFGRFGTAILRRTAGILCFILCVCFLLTPIASAAKDLGPVDGVVLYAARFGDYSRLPETGIRFGTSSWEEAGMQLSGEELLIRSSSDQKTYLLLPRVDIGTDTYTALYTFRFTDVAAANGYCGFLLTSRGDAPSNRTEFLVRANGECDGFGTLSAALAEKIAAGEQVHVRIPVRHGMLYEVQVSCGDETETLRLNPVRTIDDGGRGFVLRNASAALESVEILYGADPAEPSGYYAQHSYVASADAGEEILPPPTADAGLLFAGLAVCACLGTTAAWRRIRRTWRV